MAALKSLPVHQYRVVISDFLVRWDCKVQHLLENSPNENDTDISPKFHQNFGKTAKFHQFDWKSVKCQWYISKILVKLQWNYFNSSQQNFIEISFKLKSFSASRHSKKKKKKKKKYCSFFLTNLCIPSVILKTVFAFHFCLSIWIKRTYTINRLEIKNYINYHSKSNLCSIVWVLLWTIYIWTTHEIISKRQNLLNVSSRYLAMDAREKA